MDRAPIRTGGASASEPGTDENHAPIFNYGTVAPVNAKKYRSQWTIYILSGMNTNLLRLQGGNILEENSM